MNIKKYTATILLLLALMLTVMSCEKDNYDAPEAAISGQITDQNGKPLQTSVGTGSMSLRIVETSFSHGDSSIVVTPQYLNMKQDGSFQNIHLFAGTYEVSPWQGAFYENDDALQTQTIDLKNGRESNVDFKVTPYLDLEWVKEPYMASDGKLYASFKFKRNKKDGYAMPDLLDACIWISRTQYSGTEGDGNYTPPTTKLTAIQEGEEITLSSKIAIKYAMKYWVRIGARCNDKYQKYNFTDIKEIEVKDADLIK